MSAACIGTNGRGNSPGPIGVSLAKAVGINGTGPGIRTDRRKAKRPSVARGICEVCIYWARSGHSLMVDWGAWVIVAALAGAGNNVFIYTRSLRDATRLCFSRHASLIPMGRSVVSKPRLPRKHWRGFTFWLRMQAVRICAPSIAR